MGKDEAKPEDQDVEEKVRLSLRISIWKRRRKMMRGRYG